MSSRPKQSNQTRMSSSLGGGGEAGRGDAPEREPGDPRPTEKLKERRFNLVTVAPRTGRVNRNEQLAAGLQRLAAKLLEDLGQRITDRADSSLPEWLREAQQLGVPVRKCRHCDKIVTGPTEVCGGCTLYRM